MKLFGEFLVERGIITQFQLLEALIDQMRVLPPVCELVFQSKILTDEANLKILKEQSVRQTGYVEAASSLGFWTPEIATKLEELSAKQRIPLGAILIRKGFSKTENLSKALDEFVEEIIPEEPKAVE